MPRLATTGCGGAINLLPKSISPVRKLEGTPAGVTQLPNTGDPDQASDDFAVVAPPPP